MQIREIRPSDAEAVREIYNYEVLNTLATLDLVPRSVEMQEEWMHQHSGIHVALVCVEGESVLGFASITPYRPRPGYSSTVENSIYVARSMRRRGIGKLLLDQLCLSAGTLGFHSCIARIVATQSASIELHRACGFDLIGVEREIGRKFGQWIDIASMQKML